MIHGLIYPTDPTESPGSVILTNSVSPSRHVSPATPNPRLCRGARSSHVPAFRAQPMDCFVRNIAMEAIWPIYRWFIYRSYDRGGAKKDKVKRPISRWCLMTSRTIWIYLGIEWIGFLGIIYKIFIRNHRFFHIYMGLKPVNFPQKNNPLNLRLSEWSHFARFGNWRSHFRACGSACGIL